MLVEVFHRLQGEINPFRCGSMWPQKYVQHCEMMLHFDRQQNFLKSLYGYGELGTWFPKSHLFEHFVK